MPTLNTSPSLVRADHTLTATTAHHAPVENTALNCMEKQGFSLDEKAHAAINCLPPDGHSMNCHTIPLPAVELALMTAKLRRSTQGRTALLAAYTPRMAVDLDCHRGAAPSPRTVERAIQEGMREQAAPIVRGHIADVIRRICFLHGAAEVKKTFGTGMKELSGEHRFFLYAGKREVGTV